MNDGQRADAADVLASIGRHWGWMMAFGVLTVLAALRCWPGRAAPWSSSRYCSAFS